MKKNKSNAAKNKIYDKLAGLAKLKEKAEQTGSEEELSVVAEEQVSVQGAPLPLPEPEPAADPYTMKNGVSVKRIGFIVFLAVAALVLVIFAFVWAEKVMIVWGRISKALAPVVVGGAFAYTLNPLVSFLEKWLLKLFSGKKAIKKRLRSATRAISIVITLVLVIAFISFLVYLLVPELMSSITGLVNELPDRFSELQEWYSNTVFENMALGQILSTIIDKAYNFIEDFYENQMLSYATGILGNVVSGVWNAMSVLYNVLVGLIFSVYMLATKETLLGQSKKIVYAMFKTKTANTIVRLTGQCHTKFIGAITGKIADSAIIGLLCFIGMAIFRFPYAALVSVIVGVTNVIPFFGPYLGAVPSALLIFFISPIQCLWFIVMVIVLQQIDCNYLTPKIMSGTIGLSPFWVLFACVVFGSLFGVLGLLLGVPIMACIYMIVDELVSNRLKKRGLETSTTYYRDIKHVE